MAVLFLLLAILCLVVLGAAGLENTDPSTATLLDRSYGQLTEGQLLMVAAGLGFLVALFLFLAFGASRTRRSRRKQLRSRRRDAESRVDELERENARLRQELTSARDEFGSVDRNRAVAERDRVDDRVTAAPPEPAGVRRERLDDRTGTTPVRESGRLGPDHGATAGPVSTEAALQGRRSGSSR